MSDERMVAMSAEQHADIERYIVELMRANRNERAARMMTLALSYKFGPSTEAPLPSNVVKLDRGGTTGASPSGASRPLPQRRVSDAPVPPAAERPSASVVPLDTHSRRVPCS